MSVKNGTVEKRRKALFSWPRGWTWNEHDLLADGESTGLDIAKPPSQQKAQEKQDGKPDSNRQGTRHAATFGPAIAPVLQHEVQGPSEASQNADERKTDEVFHAADYRTASPTSAVKQAVPEHLESTGPTRQVSRPRTRRRGSFAVITLATILAISATVSLGRWQLSRAAQKESLQAGIDAQKLLPPIEQDAFLALGDETLAPSGAAGSNDLMYRPVKLRGLWLAPQTVYLDNRQMHGLQGFYVLTPFAIEGSEQTVMVQRGWVQRNFNDRTKLAPIDTPAGLVEVTGLIAPPPAQLLELGKAEPTGAAASSAEAAAVAASGSASAPGPSATAPGALDVRSAASAASAPAESVTATSASSPEVVPPVPVGSYPIRQNLSLQAFRTETRLPLRTDVSLQQTGAPSEGLTRDWPAPALGVEKHYGYAFQWFGLSALVAVLYVWFQLIAPWRRRRRERRENADQSQTVYFTRPNDPR